MENNNPSEENTSLDIPEFLKKAIYENPTAPGSGLTQEERDAIKSGMKESTPVVTTFMQTVLEQDKEQELPILAELPQEVKTNVGRHAYLFRLFELHAVLHNKIMELATAGDPDILEAACLLDQAIKIVEENVNNRHAG